MLSPNLRSKWQIKWNHRHSIEEMQKCIALVMPRKPIRNVCTNLTVIPKYYLLDKSARKMGNNNELSSPLCVCYLYLWMNSVFAEHSGGWLWLWLLLISIPSSAMNSVRSESSHSIRFVSRLFSLKTPPKPYRQPGSQQPTHIHSHIQVPSCQSYALTLLISPNRVDFLQC